MDKKKEWSLIGQTQSSIDHFENKDAYYPTQGKKNVGQ